MKASEAAARTRNITELINEFNKLSVAINSNATLLSSLSEKTGVSNICARLDYGSRLLADYKLMLSDALNKTDLDL